jgi:hypothetical protein
MKIFVDIKRTNFIPKATNAFVTFPVENQSRKQYSEKEGYNMRYTRLQLLLFAFLLLSCHSQTTPTALKKEIHPALADIPVYAGSTAWREGIPGFNERQAEHQTYSYIANVFKYETLVEFYEDKMSSDGWELLQKSKDSKTNSAELMFTRSKTVAHIQMIPWTANSYLVYVVFYDDPILEK